MSTRKTITAAVSAVIIVLTATAHATTYYVATDGNDLDTGGSTDPWRHIYYAIDQVSNGDIIEVAEGDYEEFFDFDGKAITVTSSEPNDWDVVEKTTIDGNSSHVVVFTNDEEPNSVIKGFTLTGHNGALFAAAHCDDSSPTITRCIFEDNVTGVRAKSSASPLVTNNIFRNNTDAIRVMFANTATITNNLIYDNTHGIRLVGGSTNCAVIRNNTIVDNTDHGIWAFGSSTPTPEITNCILWNNGDDLSDVLSATYSCIEDPCDTGGTGNIDDDPRFVDSDDDDYHLKRWYSNYNPSPCFDAGDPNQAYSGETDIDGLARVIGNRIDMGADEIQFPHDPPISSGGDGPTGNDWYDFLGGDGPLPGMDPNGVEYSAGLMSWVFIAPHNPHFDLEHNVTKSDVPVAHSCIDNNYGDPGQVSIEDGERLYHSYYPKHEFDPNIVKVSDIDYSRNCHGQAYHLFDDNDSFNEPENCEVVKFRSEYTLDNGGLIPITDPNQVQAEDRCTGFGHSWWIADCNDVGMHDKAVMWKWAESPVYYWPRYSNDVWTTEQPNYIDWPNLMDISSNHVRRGD